MVGDTAAARDAYEEAARWATNIAEQRYLCQRAASTDQSNANVTP
jgi:hypothetical protein